LTAMRNGVYAMLAVVVGVALVGLLPGQLSNLAAPTMETASLQGVSKEAAEGNATLSGATPSRAFDTNTTNADSVTSSEQAATTAASEIGTKTDGAGESVGFAVTATYDPYADVMYYGSWGIGLVAAISVYLVAKRMSG
jgi:hypothetical protein